MTARRGRRWVAGLAGALVLATVVGACGSGSADKNPPPTGAPTGTSTGTGGPIGSVAFGAWSQPVGGHSRDKQLAAVDALQTLLGRPLSIDHFYVPKFGPIQTWDWRLQADVAAHRTPMVSLGFGADTQQVAAGDFDSELSSYAAAIKASGAPLVLIRYAYEMDGTLNTGWVHSGPAYIAAWKHVRKAFAGLPVQMVWSPNAPAFAGKNGGVDQYWPGDSEVDWVAADGYNFYHCQGGQRDWRSFADIFDPFLAWGAAKGKPLMVAEFGTVPDPTQPNRQAEWLADALKVAAEHPDLKALVYYNSNGHVCDWRLDAQPQTAQSLHALPLATALPTVAGGTGG